MLARLDGIPGVRESRVEASGRFFLLALAEWAEEERVAADAVRALRGRAAPLPAAEAAAQVAARPRGDPWLSAAEAISLSFLEARVVATATAARAGARAGLPPEARDRLAETLRAVLFEAIERVHAEGGRDSTGWFYEEWPALAAAVAERARAFLDGPTAAIVAEALRAAHARAG